MKVLITGGTGYIGKCVCESLIEKGHEIVAISRNEKRDTSKIHWVQGNLMNLDSLDKAITEHDIDACIHLAWEGIPDYSYSMSQVNLQQGLNILELCERKNIKHLVVSGSCWEYKNPVGCIDEEWELSLENGFKVCKNALQFVMAGVCKEKGIKFHWLRLFYVIGRGQKEISLLPYIIRELIQGREPIIKEPQNENDFIDVEDVAKAFVEILQNNSEMGIFNVGSGKCTSVDNVVNMVKILLRKEVCHKNNNLNRENKISFYADISKIHESSGWYPNIPLEHTIKNMIEYYIEEQEGEC